MDKNDEDKLKKLKASIAILILTVVIVGGVILSRPKSNPAIQPTSVTASDNTNNRNSTSSSQPNKTTNYKNGTYSASGSYDSPGGTETVKVSLTVVSNVVTASSVQSEANDPTASSYQTLFISGYKPFVVGKKLNTVKLTNVSGSSLTSQGFNNALKQIENQAQA